MGSIISLISMVMAGVCAAVGIFVFKRKKLFILAISLAVLFFVFPFARDAFLTRDGYPWTLVVQREVEAGTGRRVIFLEGIEWITDYEKLKRRRGDVGSLLLDDDTTRKVWKVKGYIPLAIRADVLYGTDSAAIGRQFADFEPGSYTFTLTFDENDLGSWDVQKQ